MNYNNPNSLIYRKYGYILPQEPGESQNYPPEGAGHAKEVDKQEHYSAGCRSCRLIAYNIVWSVRISHRITCYRLMPHDKSNYVTNADHHVAGRQEDDGSFRVAKG